MLKNNLFRKNMGVIVNKNNDQDGELSRRITEDLRRKAIENDKDVDGKDVDLAEDAEYLKDLKKTSKFGWIWIVLIVLAIASIISIILI